MFNVQNNKNQNSDPEILSNQAELKTTEQGELGYQFFNPDCFEVLEL